MCPFAFVWWIGAYAFGVAIVESVESNWGWLSVVALGVFAPLVWLVYRNILKVRKRD
jgi:hypothetical protein